MDELVAAIIVIAIVYGIYRIFELFVQRKERMAIIDKFQPNFDASALKDQLKLPLFAKSSSFSFATLRIGLLLIGIGIGLIIAFCIDVCLFDQIISGAEVKSSGYNAYYAARHIIDVAYGACLFVFGGLGLLIACLIEQKKEKK